MKPARTLAAGEVVAIEGARGVEVHVDSGRLWITEEARNDDIWLSAGDHARLTGPGLAVLEAIGATRVHFE